MNAPNEAADFDCEFLAQQAVDLLEVAPGQVIWVWASTHSIDLIAALAFRIRQRGAYWTLRLIHEPLLQRIGLGLPEEYLPLVPQHELRWMDDMHGIIAVHDHGGHIPGVPIPRRRAMAAEWIALIDEAARRGLRRISITNPTQALADAYGLPLADLRQRYWQAMNIDHGLLDKRQARLGGLLGKASQVHLTCPLGSDLHLTIAGRPVHLDTNGLPRGEVYLAPHEDSAQGRVVIEQAFFSGRRVGHLQLTFEAGRVVDIQAPNADDVQVLRTLLDASTGDKDVIAEFALGLNPGASEPCGDIGLDEKIYASAHIALGANQTFGGRNQANLHLDLVIQHPTVYLDGNLLLEQDLFWMEHVNEEE